MLKRILNKIKLHEFKSILIELLKWKIIDIYRFFKYKPDPHLYGVRCITGMYGCGKTMAMSKIALDYRSKYGDSIYISSNYGLAIQDFPFNDIKELSTRYDKPVLYFWDEVQNDFPADDRVFSKEVRQALTLNRKGCGKMYFWASQDHELVHKTIRRLTLEFGVVRTFWGRYTRLKWYRKLDYELLYEQTDWKKTLKIHPCRKLKFVQTDYIRNLYDSYSLDNGESVR